MENENNRQKKTGGFTLRPATVLVIIAAILALSVASTSFYKVDESEQAVITRFGRYYKTVGPGLQFKIPFGIDKHYIVPVTEIQTEQFGVTRVASNQSYGTTSSSGGLTMLTGDLNIVD
ncbi:MAG: SPFH domain-containing protein, partial [Spirochaetales bacterium]